jgi:Probable cobalt transporter subunit (CbtA)
LRTTSFLAVTLFSGMVAGVILGLINQITVEPFIDRAIGIETRRDIAKGEVINPTQQDQYRIWQKAGELVAAGLYGITVSALFGIVFVYSRSVLPGSSNKNKALFLAAVMFFVLFLVPALKYPANPPAVGDPNTIYYREILFTGFIAISGLSTLILALVYNREKIFASNTNNPVKKKLVVALIYAAIMTGAYLVFPPNPDNITIPIDLIVNFRVVSALSVGIFWKQVELLHHQFNSDKNTNRHLLLSSKRYFLSTNICIQFNFLAWFRFSIIHKNSCHRR